ncbi:MAG TPA: uroporphyrinogen-III C-methyltransferase [Candidatus Acidoferrales bacterium]|nr:uroporphyrinogen-III C-methyltransferase [Candidatus Acidoferrales bacterium]
MNEKCRGKVYLVGAGPGDPGLLTVKADRLLRRADVVLHDDLVPEPILALARPDTEVANVGKRCGVKGITQDEINARMIRAARSGLQVVRLKSGDPGIFGRLAEEIDALESAEVPFEVVPGITAGTAAAAALGVSLTDRRNAARVVVVTNHEAHGATLARKTDWKALIREDATLLIYMPGHDFGRLRAELLAAALSPETPAAIVSRATIAGERHRFTTLGELDRLPRMESPAVLLIGWSLDRARRRSADAAASRAFNEAELILSSL